MALFSVQRPFLPTDWQYIWKRKANAYHIPLSKSTDTIFLTSSRPRHALHCLLWICNSDLPTTRFSTKKVFFLYFFCILSIIPDSDFVLYTFSQLYTYLHPRLYIQVHLTRLHLNTSWKTRHLVFSHITSEKRYLVPTCTQTFYIWYNLQKCDHENSALDLF